MNKALLNEVYFLHSMGYTFFDEAKLTYQELSFLKTSQEQALREQKRLMKKQNKMNKRRTPIFDRIIHHDTMVVIDEESFRKKHQMKT